MSSTPAPGAAEEGFAPRLALLLALALAAWSSAVVRGGLALDDAELLASPFVRGAVGWEALRADYWAHLGAAGHWRPLALASLRLQHALGLARVAWLHAGDVALHLAVVALAALLARRVARLGGARLPWLGLAFFALHPALADAVAWISARSSLLCAAGGLLGACLVARELERARPRAAPLLGGSALALLLALAGKEEGLVFAPLLALLALRRGARACAWSCAGALLGLALASLLRADALGSALPSAPHAPLAHAPLLERLSVGGLALLEGLRLAALPLPHAPLLRQPALLAAHPPQQVLSEAAIALRAGAGLAFLAVLAGAGALALARRGRACLPGAAAVLVACAALPYLQLVPAGELFAPRFLYLPLLLAAPLSDALLRRALPPRGARCGLALGAGALIALCWLQAGAYASRAAWARAVLARAPADARAWNELALGLEEQGQVAQAERAWRRALQLDPGYGRPWSNLARLRLARGDGAGALEALERAVASGRANPLAWHNLGVARLRLERLDEARAAFSRALELAPGHAPSWRALARTELAAGREAAAARALARALALDRDDPATRALLRELEARARARDVLHSER